MIKTKSTLSRTVTPRDVRQQHGTVVRVGQRPPFDLAIGVVGRIGELAIRRIGLFQPIQHTRPVVLDPPQHPGSIHFSQLAVHLVDGKVHGLDATALHLQCPTPLPDALHVTPLTPRHDPIPVLHPRHEIAALDNLALTHTLGRSVKITVLVSINA
ncbi:hypothetical protein D3C78_1438920 [compost metagenome]